MLSSACALADARGFAARVPLPALLFGFDLELFVMAFAARSRKDTLCQLYAALVCNSPKGANGLAFTRHENLGC
jgi:hypothetical protein